jgi:hypothetical protein
MAAKTPDSIYTTSLGDFRLIVADFTTTNIDNDDYWTSGIRSKLAHWTGATTDNKVIAIDAYDTSDGKMTFGTNSGTDWTGQLCILCKGY